MDPYIIVFSNFFLLLFNSNSSIFLIALLPCLVLANIMLH
jgi:hypothetical protein